MLITYSNNYEIKQTPWVSEVSFNSIRRQFEDEFEEKDDVEELIKLVKNTAHSFRHGQEG